MQDAVNTPTSRTELLEAILEGARRNSTATILFHHAVAEHLGLNPSDHKCADLVARAGPMTAGELADLSGLSTGAITGVIDRLEQAGAVRREHDPADRRRVIVSVVEDCPFENEGSAIFESLCSSALEALADYSDEELRLLLDYFARVDEVFRSEAAKLRDLRPEEVGPPQAPR